MLLGGYQETQLRVKLLVQGKPKTALPVSGFYPLASYLLIYPCAKMEYSNRAGTSRRRKGCSVIKGMDRCALRND